MAANMMKQMASMGLRDRMQFAKQMGSMDLFGSGPQLKIKQRSTRLTNKQRQQRKKTRRR